MDKKRNVPIWVLSGIGIVVIVAVVAIIVIFAKGSGNELQKQLDLGRKYMSEMEYEKAIAAYKTVMEIDSKCEEAYIKLADIYVAMNDTSKAVEVLKEGYTQTQSQEILNRIEEAEKEMQETESSSAPQETEGSLVPQGTETLPVSKEDGVFEGPEKPFFENSYVIPEGVTEIGEYAFENCTSLTSIEVPASVTKIGVGAFSGCTSLTSIEIPEGVTEIGESAFENCSSLTVIEIPASVTEIGEHAFGGCNSLTVIEIPVSMAGIVDDVFYGCNIEVLVTCY